MADKTLTDEPLSPEAAQLLAEQTAAQVAGSPNPAGAAAESAAAMAGAAAGPTLPAEEDIAKFMLQMMEQYDQMKAELEALKTQQATALASQGAPYILRYAQGAADKAAALVVAHPDAPAGHFAQLTAATGQLTAAAAAALKGGAVADVEKAAAAVGKFATRVHPRAWGKHIDWSALLDDAETVVEEAVKIAAAA